MKLLPITILGIALLSGCASQPEPTLEQKLAGKSPAERQVILREECQAEAIKGHKGAYPRPSGNYYDTSYVPHVHKLNELCRAMTNVPSEGDK